MNSIIRILLVGIILSWANSAVAENIFLKFPTSKELEGDSLVAGFEKSIEIQGLDWGLAGTEDPNGNCQKSQLNMVKLSDSSTPGIITAATTGRTIENAILTIVTPTPTNFTPVLRLKLIDIKVSHYNFSMSEDQDTPKEFISLQYGRIDGTSFQQSPQGKVERTKFTIECN